MPILRRWPVGDLIRGGKSGAAVRERDLLELSFTRHGFALRRLLLVRVTEDEDIGG